MRDLLGTVKVRLISGWNFLRIVRLGLAVILTAEAWMNSEALFAVIGGFLAFQAVFNYGCCGTRGCAIDDRRFGAGSRDRNNEIVNFEEIK